MPRPTRRTPLPSVKKRRFRTGKGGSRPLSQRRQSQGPLSFRRIPVYPLGI